MPAQTEIAGRFATAHAQKYMTQLCTHFAHKIPATVDGETAEARFAMGIAHMSADNTALTVRLTAETADAAAQMKPIIDDHLRRFAFREKFTQMAWNDAPQS